MILSRCTILVTKALLVQKQPCHQRWDGVNGKQWNKADWQKQKWPILLHVGFICYSIESAFTRSKALGEHHLVLTALLPTACREGRRDGGRTAGIWWPIFGETQNTPPWFPSNLMERLWRLSTRSNNILIKKSRSISALTLFRNFTFKSI